MRRYQSGPAHVGATPRGCPRPRPRSWAGTGACPYTFILLLVLGIPELSIAQDQPSPIDLVTATQAFAEARAACEADDGELWGVSLCGPFLLVDPQSRAVVASQGPEEPPSEGALERRGELFTGLLPKALPATNTAVDWAGTRWTMVRWPLPEDRDERVRLLTHEAFHRIQDAQLGLPMANPSNPHLDTLEGRLWLQLEWRALARAVRTKGKKREEAIRDLLVFRQQRDALFPDGAPTEKQLELNEGLAEDTGVVLAYREPAARRKRVLNALEQGATEPTFVRSFAYASGPAYGLLLDALAPGWRKDLEEGDDLAEPLALAVSFEPSEDLATAADTRAGGYEGEELRATETRRKEEAERRTARLEALLITGPVLVLPLQNANLSFDPSNLIPLGDHGTVYPTLRAADAWGVLEVETPEGGALVATDWTSLRVAAPAELPDGWAEAAEEARTLEGEGWRLEVAAGWRVEREENGPLALVQ